MTKRDTFSIVLRISGIFLLIRGILTACGIPIGIALAKAQLNFVKGATSQTEFYSTYIFWMIMEYIITATINTIVGFLLLQYSEKISAKFIAEDKEINISGTGDWSRSALLVALKIIGIYFLIEWIPTLIKVIIEHFSGSISLGASEKLPQTISMVVIMAASLYMIFGTNHLLRMLYSKKENPPTPEVK